MHFPEVMVLWYDKCYYYWDDKYGCNIGFCRLCEFMCKANDKLIVFSYAFEKFINYQKRIATSQAFDDEVFKSFSNTRLMKLMYCLCLESLVVNDEVGDDDLVMADCNLFDFFGNFNALRNGPVLLDIYRALDIIPGFKYEDGSFIGFDEETKITIPTRLDYIKTQINQAFDRLMKNLSVSIFMDRDKLVSLTHKLPIWTKTFIYSIEKTMSIQEEDLKQEYIVYRQLQNKDQE